MYGCSTKRGMADYCCSLFYRKVKKICLGPIMFHSAKATFQAQVSLLDSPIGLLSSVLRISLWRSSFNWSSHPPPRLLWTANRKRQCSYFQVFFPCSAVLFYWFQNDIALVHLNTPVMFSDYIRPVCLPKSGGQPGSGISCIVAGWGFKDEEEKFPGWNSDRTKSVYRIWYDEWLSWRVATD